MARKGKAGFPPVIEAALKENPQIRDVDTFRRDCNCILEAIVAELDLNAILDALTNQGLDAKAYKTNLKRIRGFALERRPKRLAGTEFDVDKAIDEYRNATDRLETAKGEAKKKLQADIKKMRLRWKEWQGEDRLHETAFG